MAGPVLTRLFGGPPVTVLFRLLLASLVVGAVLIWLDIRPSDVFGGLQRLAMHIWGDGFDAVREAANYIAVGAMIVVPLWLLARLLRLRGPR